MFCTKCGFKNPDNANFCKKCGAKMPQMPTAPAQPTTYANPHYSNYAPPYQSYPSPINTAPLPNVAAISYSVTSNIKKLYYITLFFHALSIILFFVPSLFASASYSNSFEREEAISMFQLFSNASSGFAFVTTAIKIVAAILTALPLLNTSGKKPSKLIIPKIVAILEFLWLLFSVIIMIIEANNQSSSYGLDIDASAGLTIGGYLYLASLLALLIMLFVTTAKSKKQ